MFLVCLLIFSIAECSIQQYFFLQILEATEKVRERERGRWREKQRQRKKDRQGQTERDGMGIGESPVALGSSWWPVLRNIYIYIY